MKTIAIAILCFSVTAYAKPTARRSREVRRIQVMLSERTTDLGLMLPKMEIDGVMGPVTERCIRSNIVGGQAKR